MLDRSGTMKRAFPYSKTFAKLISEHFQISQSGAHVGVVTFGEDAELQIALDAHDTYPKFENAVDKIPFEGYRTRIHRAFEVASEKLFNVSHGSRPGIPKLLFLVTDGRQSPQSNVGKFMRSFKTSIPLLLRQVQIVAIGLHGTTEADVKTLQFLTRSRKNVYIIDDPKELSSRKFLDGLVYNYCQEVSEANVVETTNSISRN